LKYDKPEIAKRSFEKYIAAGGSPKGAKQSIRMLNPRYLVAKRDFPAFMEYLDERDLRGRYDASVEYYIDTFLNVEPHVEKPKTFLTWSEPKD
jgi:hypothetical protein